MEHHFNVELATIYGIEEAIMIDNLYFWIKKNIANNQHLYDDRVWTFNSAKAWAELFPYLSETKIYRILNNLEDKGFIISGNYNNEKTNRTKWYSFTDNGLKILYSNGYNIVGFSTIFQNEELQFAKMQNGICKNAKCIISNDIYSNTDTIQQIKKESKLSKKDNDCLFEECWVAYRRRGKKGKAKEYWDKLTNKERKVVLQHIKQYTQTRDWNYQQEFQRYLRDKTFLSVIADKKGNILYDPDRESGDAPYTPATDGSIHWSDIDKCYYYLGFWDGKFIPDGYEDNERPNGATIVLNNGRGILVWNKETNKWIKK